MLYPIVRPLAAITLRAFFPRIYLANRAGIPAGKPVLLVSNHPTTFTEPCVLACFLDRPLYYLVRGDFFEQPIFNAILRDLHMIPVYRQQEGFRNLKNNYGTIDGTIDWLEQGKMVMILAEGTAIHEKRLRPLRKGAARIAMMAMDRDPNLELYVVPVGVNYTDALTFGTQAMVNFDEPFLASEYFGPDKGPKGKAINAFTKHLTQRLQENTIIIENPADDWLFNKLLEIKRNNAWVDRPLGVSESPLPFKVEKDLSMALNQLEAEEKTAIKKMVKSYDHQLMMTGLTDDYVNRQPCDAKNMAWVILGAIPNAISWLIHFLPWLGMRYVTDQKVIFNEFFGSVRIAAWLVLIWIYYLFLFVIGVVTYGWWGLAIFSLVPLLGWMSIQYQKKWRIWKQYQKWQSLHKDQRQWFMEKRKQIIKQITQVTSQSKSN